MAAKAATPITVIAQKVERQPSCWPSSVPRGTPSTLAIVSPPNISAIAPAFLAGSTSPAATTEPIPKNAPWQSAATDPAGEHHRVGAGEGGEQVADDEEHHQAEQHLLARQPGDGGGEADRADRDAERVARDQPAGGGLGHREVGGDLGQQPGDDELGQADAEPADGEGEQSGFHG